LEGCPVRGGVVKKGEITLFFIMGISPKIKPLGSIRGGVCPACGGAAELALIHKYMTPHIFFIPTFKFHSEYIATCGRCASILALNEEKARMFAKNPDTVIRPQDLRVIKNNMRM
jgi:hypothetical protein